MWIDINEIQPPDLTLKVKDAEGNEGYANPTYYPFKSKIGGKKGEIEMCDPYWDGGWMIDCGGLFESNLGTITHYEGLFETIEN